MQKRAFAFQLKMQRLEHQAEEQELGLKTTKLSIKQGRNPPCGHIHTPIDRVIKVIRGGKKFVCQKVSPPFWRQRSFNLHEKKAPPLCACKEKQVMLNRGNNLCNKLEYVSCEILLIRLCVSVAHKHHRLQLHQCRRGL